MRLFVILSMFKIHNLFQNNNYSMNYNSDNILDSKPNAGDSNSIKNNCALPATVIKLNLLPATLN